MGLALPFEFDTSDVVATLLRGVLGLLLVVVLPGVVYSLFVSRNAAAALALLVVAALTAYFGRRFLANLSGSRGTITGDAVIVQPVRVYGIRLTGPEGTFPIHQFKAVRVERVSPPVEAYGGPHARVSLVGKDATPNILIARTALDDGRALGRDLATTLKLPLDEPAGALLTIKPQSCGTNTMPSATELFIAASVH